MLINGGKRWQKAKAIVKRSQPLNNPSDESNNPHLAGGESKYTNTWLPKSFTFDGFRVCVCICTSGEADLAFLLIGHFTGARPRPRQRPRQSPRPGAEAKAGVIVAKVMSTFSAATGIITSSELLMSYLQDSRDLASNNDGDLPLCSITARFRTSQGSSSAASPLLKIGSSVFLDLSLEPVWLQAHPQQHHRA